jgi:DNA (cytosine-5)-methyltransferase 1
MKYGSVCSGIEAASVAWHNLKWEPQWFSEIEQFPSEVLKHRFPAVPNLGDMTTINQNPIADERPIDLLVGGTPCQSFSVAGLRKGLDDPRGNLMLTFLSIADKLRPKWIVWENVPGVLSSNGGKDFGTFLGALGELGYGFAYRVLDAQHFGVAQRRRRVFVVGYLGDWRPPAAVLFERESLQGNTKPSRKKREEVASNVEGSVGEAGDVSCVGGNLSPTVTSKWMKGYGGPSGSNETGNMVYAPTVIDRAAFNQGENAQYEPRIEEGETMSSLVAKGPHAVAQPISIDAECNARTNQFGTLVRGGEGGTQQFVAQPIAIQDVRPIEKAQNGRGWNDDGTSYTVDTKATQGVAQPIAVDTYNYTTNDHTTQTIRSQSDTEHIGAVLQPIAVDWRTAQVDQGIAQTLKTDLAKMSGPCIAVDVYNQKTTGDKFGVVREQHGTNMNAVLHSMAIRRLTPKECERLQGFPDDWTKIPYRNKEADQCPDGPRYKACGNSMAVPVMRWIGQRIQYVENLMKEL